MADLVLTGQATVATAIKAKTADLESALNARREVWDRMPIEKKRAWIAKDPVLTLAWDEFVFLHKFFTGMADGKL